MDQMPKNRLNSVNRLGTTITTRRMLGRGNGFMACTRPAPSPRPARGGRPPPAPSVGWQRGRTHPPVSRIGSCPSARPASPAPRPAHVLTAARPGPHRAAEEDKQPDREQKQRHLRSPHPGRPARHPGAEHDERPPGKDEGPPFGASLTTPPRPKGRSRNAEGG